MNRKKFIMLVAMMLLSIIGIIWVQIFWIKNAVAIRNETFDYNVGIRLTEAGRNIEMSRNMDFFNNFMLTSPFPSSDTSGDISGFLSIESYSSQPGNQVNVNSTIRTITGSGDSARVTTRNHSYIQNADTSYVTDSVSYVVAAPDESGQMKIRKMDAPDNSQSQGVYIKQNEFLNWLRKRASEFQNMSDQMISDIYQWEKTLELDNREIASLLNRSFSVIRTPYEFAVIRNGVVQEGTFRKTKKDEFLKSPYRIQLFPDNLIRQDVVLSVVFPKRTNYILGSIAWILGGSMLFSLFILATFAFSVYFIITQKKVSEMKSDFLNNMTHEFKTPIATISLAADTITNPKVIKDESSVRHFIGMIKKENSRMNKKVETILQIASLDKKEIDFKFENVSIHTIIEHSVETIDIQVQQRSGKINLNLQAGEPVICGDYDHLTNLVNNFLDNAIKYSPDAPEITVSTKNTDKGIILSIEDKGIGMSKAVQSRIFERFYRQTSGNVHDVKGFGLGLNYARAIIDAHKGTVAVTSEVGKGSRFDIFLPFNPES